VIVIVLVPLVPCVIATLPGDADRLKSGVAAAFTIRVTVVVWIAVPLVPVTVIVWLPVGVPLVVVTVIVEEPEVVIVGGLKAAFAPAGSPLALRVTVPVNPLTAPTVTAYVVLLPWTTDWEGGVAESVKSGAVETQDGKLKDASRVFQLKLPVAGRYSLAYQNVQSSAGSTLILV
jgi:hypothetical protein